jgi:hypothetical protein
MLAACLACLWIVCLGVQAIQKNYLPSIHRSDRCDLSLFQPGLRLLEHLLDFHEPIPVSFVDCKHDYTFFVR